MEKMTSQSFANGTKTGYPRLSFDFLKKNYLSTPLHYNIRVSPPYRVESPLISTQLHPTPPPGCRVEKLKIVWPGV